MNVRNPQSGAKSTPNIDSSKVTSRPLIRFTNVLVTRYFRTCISMFDMTPATRSARSARARCSLAGKLSLPERRNTM